MGGGDKQGVLLSGGRDGTLNSLRVATVRQLWAVLSGPFLLCYKSKNVCTYIHTYKHTNIQTYKHTNITNKLVCQLDTVPLLAD